MFMQNVHRLTPAQEDTEHIRTVADGDPKIPNCSRALQFNQQSPLDAMLQSCQRLAASPVDAIAIPSNSAHHWHSELQRKLKVPLFNIVEVTARRLKLVGGAHKAVVLADYVPWHTRSYLEPLRQLGVEYCHLEDSDQILVQQFIKAIKLIGAVKDCGAGFKGFLLEILKKHDADCVILASAELSVFREQRLDNCTIVDSSEALAHAVVDFAYHGRPLEFDVGKVRAFWGCRGQRLKTNSLGLLQAGMFTKSEAEAEERWESERREVSQLLAGVVRRDDVILEPGCGTGRWTRELARMSGHVVAFDPCTEFIEVARGMETGAPNPSRIEYTIGDICGFYSERQFDGIFVSGLLQYLSEPEFCQFNKLMKDRTKPGGWLCIKQTIALDRHIELRGFFSETMEEEYSALYRTEGELLKGVTGSFTLVESKLVFSPTSDKPETCQKAFLLTRIG
jgi:aspartate racemase